MDITSSTLAAYGTGAGVLKVTGTAASTNAKQTSSVSGVDTVSFSDQGRLMAIRLKAASKKSTTTSADNSTDPVGVIKQRMKVIQQEIKKIQESNIPERDKQKRIQQLSSELVQLNDQLTRLEKESGTSSIKGGTAAQGFSSSLT